jgi:hypothetical protein
MTGRHVLILTVALLALTGMRHASAQQPDAFERAKCQDDFISLRTAVETRGKALQAAGKRKANPVEVCKLLRDYTATEAKMLKFLQERQAVCGIPDQLIGQAKAGNAKSSAMREQVCKVAANPPAQAAPPPSQGLSGALGTNYGGPPSETAGGSGVFDTLTGNVLKR